MKRRLWLFSYTYCFVEVNKTMEKLYKETTIPSDFKRLLAESTQFLLAEANTEKVVTAIIHGISCALGKMKHTSTPKAVTFHLMNGEFLIGAKVEYIPNDDDPSNPSAGRWDYTWTFYKDDLADAECIECIDNRILAFIASSAFSLYGFKIESVQCQVSMIRCAFETIKAWFAENISKEDPSATLILDGVFKATGVLEDNQLVLSLVPDGEMKVLIKDDLAIQEF